VGVGVFCPLSGNIALKAQKNKIETRLAKYKITSPLAGRLVKLHKFNSGDVLKAGDILAEISPNEGDLNFEAKVQPTDISMVKVGNPARITLTAFNRYEVKPIIGKVTYVSSSSLVDSEGKSFFLARVTPDVGYLEAVQKVSPLGVGMSAEISISSGSRSILAFLLSPLMRGASKTFTEK
jgi:multidrug efflux pump subunit AcrA (membrane-fusion protein)